MSENTVFFDLYKVDVSNVVEKKNKLTYLSWSWAWAEVCKRYPKVSYEIERFGDQKRPYQFDENLGYMVHTTVTIENQTHEMWLTVMDGANKAMKHIPYEYQVKKYENRQWTGDYETKTVEAATMFDINKSIMRCLVKNLAMFGLGLYLYAGEDMPEDITMLEPASEREKKTFMQVIEKVAEEYGTNYVTAIEKLCEVTKITGDESKWTKGDLGLFKRGINWLKEELGKDKE